jgi:Spy/CpxP family protein refolding chaperone
MRKKLILAIVLVAGGLGAAVATAQAPHGGPPGHERLTMMPFEAVLSPQQKQTLYATVNADRAKIQALHQRLHEARESLIEKLLSPDATVDVSKETAELKAAQSAMIDERVSIALATRKLLSPQQLKDAAVFHTKLEDLHRQEAALIGQMNSGRGDVPPPGDE